MRTIEIKGMFGGGHTVRLFDSTKELTSEKTNDLNKLVLQDIGVGSDMDAVAGHFSQFHTLLVNKKSDEALQEAKNLHNNLYYMIQKINIKSLCFSVFIQKIDNDYITDLSDEGARKTVKRLSDIGMTDDHVKEELEDLKKKLTQNFEPIFLIDMETTQ